MHRYKQPRVKTGSRGRTRFSGCSKLVTATATTNKHRPTANEMDQLATLFPSPWLMLMIQIIANCCKDSDNRLGWSRSRFPARSPLSTARETICSAIEALQAEAMYLRGEGGESMLHHVEKERLSLPYLKKSIVYSCSSLIDSDREIWKLHPTLRMRRSHVKRSSSIFNRIYKYSGLELG